MAAAVARAYAGTMVATMVPAGELLTPPAADSNVLPSGRPRPALRDELRRIPSVRNGLSVLSCWVQTVGIVVLACASHHPLAWAAAFLLMGRAHAQFAALMHEAAHRLLFADKRLNDRAGRWLLGYPSFTNTDAYRRVHMAHHREEFGPDEPDLALYAGYPITRASLRRKLVRDATGRTGWKLLKAQLASLRSPDPRSRRTIHRILAVQLVLALVALAAGYPLAYWLLWLAPYLTVWRVINRLRSIAEHGGLERSEDRRRTTHSVRQHALARFCLVPYWIGWHLAHHCDSGVPMRHLPRLHRELVASGYVGPGLEHPSYRALWAKLSSRTA